MPLKSQSINQRTRGFSDAQAMKLMALTAFSVGLAVFHALTMPDHFEGLAWKIVLSFVAMFVYAIAGSAVVLVCERLRFWAYRHEIEPWTDAVRLSYGAFWPVMLFFSVVVYAFLGVVHRAVKP